MTNNVGVLIRAQQRILIDFGSVTCDLAIVRKSEPLLLIQQFLPTIEILQNY